MANGIPDAKLYLTRPALTDGIRRSEGISVATIIVAAAALITARSAETDI